MCCWGLHVFCWSWYRPCSRRYKELTMKGRVGSPGEASAGHGHTQVCHIAGSTSVSLSGVFRLVIRAHGWRWRTTGEMEDTPSSSPCSYLILVDFHWLVPEVLLMRWDRRELSELETCRTEATEHPHDSQFSQGEKIQTNLASPCSKLCWLWERQGQHG